MKNPVPYRVECDPQGKTFFEVIAAFNSERVALAYATDCKVSNPANDYRVVNRKRVLHEPAYIHQEAIIQAKLGRAQ